ncbi:MAG: hypothetical protein ACI4LP_03230 [Anaerovoracaceae bacterium]
MSFFDMDFDTMLRKLEELEKSYDMELAQLERLAPGHLSSINRKGNLNYLQIRTDSGNYHRHGISREPEILRMLCRKAYIKEILMHLRRNIRCLKTAKSQYSPLDYMKSILNLPPVYQTVPQECFFPMGDKDFLKNLSEEDAALTRRVSDWISSPYEMSTFMPEMRTHTTSRGEKMRSKGEVVIAELMYKHKVPFRYEPVIHIGKFTLSFDFTPLRTRDFKVFYWEHCGMPHDAEYMKKHKWKLEMYESQGIVPWDNLIVTYNDIYGNVDTRIIESEIINKLL